MRHLGVTQEEIIKTGAEAVLELQKAGNESSAFIQQAAVHPDQTWENARKMSLLGWMLTIYTLDWLRQKLF